MNRNNIVTTEAGNSMSAKDYQKWLKDKAKERARENEALVKRYIDELNKTQDEQVALSTVCDAFNCTPVRVRNQVSKATGYLNPATKSMNEAKLLVYMDKMANLVDSAIEYGVERLEALNEVGDDALVEIEVNDGRIKSIPAWKQKKEEYRDLIAYQQEVFKSIKSLLPQTVLNNVINNVSDVNKMSDADLDRELEIEENKYRKGDTN